MNRTVIAVAAVLVTSSALAQTAHFQESARFGDEIVTLKTTKHQDLSLQSGEFEKTVAAIEATSDPNEKERLWRVLWENGEATALAALAFAYEQRGDMLQAYVHLFALNEFAKYSAKVSPLGPARKRYHDSVTADLERVGQSLTAEQKASGTRLAAQLMRSNPSCCAPM